MPGPRGGGTHQARKKPTMQKTPQETPEKLPGKWPLSSRQKFMQKTLDCRMVDCYPASRKPRVRKMAKALRAAIYLRVSTGEQTTENQRRELEAAAAARGWTVIASYSDEGISGSKGRDQRPGLDAMLKDATRRKFDVVMAWAVDRLGRSLPDLISTMQTLHGAKIDLFLHQQAIDTTTPAGRAMFGMMGVFAEFERSMIQSRVKAGLERAKEQGVKLGRRPVAPKVETAIRQRLTAGTGMLKIASELGVGSGTVQRIAKEMRAAAP